MEWLDITVRGALVCRYQCILCTAFGAFKSSILFQQVTCCAGFIGRHVLKPETTKRNVVLVILFRLFRFIVSGYSTCLIGWLKYRIAFSFFFFTENASVWIFLCMKTRKGILLFLNLKLTQTIGSSALISFQPFLERSKITLLSAMIGPNWYILWLLESYTS